jgi:hypothetical protein
VRGQHRHGKGRGSLGGVTSPVYPSSASAMAGRRLRAGVRSGVVHAAYASGQNSIYLAAGVAALIGGVLVLALIRPGPPAEPDQASAGANAPAVSVRSPS